MARSNPISEILPSGKHCLGEPRSKLLFNHTLAGSINPLGLENQFRLSLCVPLIRKPGLLFDFTNVEFGLANYISPTHFHLGGFVNLTPLSVLVLRAEVTGLFIWPLQLQGAGYIPLAGYKDFTRDTLSPLPEQPQAGRAYGVRTLLGATLQGQVPLGKRASLAILNAFSAEYWRTAGLDVPAGQNLPYYYLARKDVIVRADGDWVLGNTAVLLAMINLTENYVLRVGVNDELTAVPRPNDATYIGNLVGGILAFMVRDAGGVARNLQIFLRGGTYTHHGFRSGFTLAGGLDAIYDLTPGSLSRPRLAP